MADVLPFDQSKASLLLGVGECWAIEGGYADDAIAILSQMPVADCVRFAIEERRREQIEAVNAAARKAAGEKDPRPYPVVNGTAIFQVRGTMTKSRSSWGGASTKAISAGLLAAGGDEDVLRILMIFETPGGECAGCAEFSDVIASVNAVKPVIAYLEDNCASAGIFAASTCGQIFMNRMGMAGCIGTLAIVWDYSQAIAMQGIKVIKFTSEGTGTYKGMGMEGTELTEAHKAHLQSVVDHYGKDFRATIQRGRNLTDEQVSAVATGKMFTADEALSLGLIDGICSMEKCLENVSRETSGVKHGSMRNEMPENDKPSLAQRLSAWLKGEGIDVDASASAAPNDAHPTLPMPPAPIDPAIKAQLEAQEESIKAFASEKANDLAKSFAASLCVGKDAKCAPAEFNGIIGLFTAALSADGGGAPRFEGGKLVEGATVKAVRDSYAARPAHFLTDMMIGHIDSDGKLLDADGGKDKPDEKRLARLLASTATGRAALAAKGASN